LLPDGPITLRSLDDSLDDRVAAQEEDEAEDVLVDRGQLRLPSISRTMSSTQRSPSSSEALATGQYWP
jgi:hypothetical protein